MESVAAIVLAAGLSARFGTPKALATFAGRPLLEHVLECVRSCRFDETIVVLGAGADDIERAIAWRGERIVRNPRPEDGLAGSLRVGMAALDEGLGAACIFLGDQPLVRRVVVEALLSAEPAPAVIPRYAAGGGRNPVLLRRSAWPLVEAASGDRGLGPLLHAHPELTHIVDVDGANPDVDTPEELAALEARFDT